MHHNKISKLSIRKIIKNSINISFKVRLMKMFGKIFLHEKSTFHKKIYIEYRMYV